MQSNILRWLDRQEDERKFQQSLKSRLGVNNYGQECFGAESINAHGLTLTLPIIGSNKHRCEVRRTVRPRNALLSCHT
jgi:hypothetical protein